MPFSIERFGTGHSLVTNRVDPRITLPMLDSVKELPKMDLARMGLFEVSAPDFNKYYPEVTSKDLTPAEEDFVNPIFRALSKIIINKHGPIDFSQGNVLEDSMPLLIGQAVYSNHEQIVGNELGVISEAFFQNTRTYSGVKVPAGINIRAKIDGKSNPKIARSVMMDPPSVHSTSVTVAFNWEQSHKNLTVDDFWKLIGTLDDKGKLIRRVVTKIIRYDEISLVSHGADPFAQKIGDDGKIVNPKYASTVYKFSEGDNRAVYHYTDWKNFGNGAEIFSLDDTIPLNLNNNSNNNPKSTMNEQTLIFLRAFFGMDAASPEADVVAKLNAELPVMKAAQASLTAAQTELATTKTALSALQQKYPEGSTVMTAEDKANLAKFETQKTQIAELTTQHRNECLKLYHLSVGGSAKADTSITKLIAEASLEALQGLTKQYTAQVEKDFKATCSDCGSHNVTRASGENPPAGQVTPEPGTDKTKATADVVKEAQQRASAPRVNLIHEVPQKK